MFEAAELGHEVDDESYERREAELREKLLAAQVELLQRKEFELVVVVDGLDFAGRSETVNKLHEWLDPRQIETRAFDEPTDVEREKPRMWRYWNALPPKGKLGIIFGGWYSDPLDGRFARELDEDAMDALLADAVKFERMLAHEGALVLKFWFHMPEHRQRKRLKKLEKDPLTRWRVSDVERDHLKHYGRYTRTAEHLIRETDSAEAPWSIVEGSDDNFRNLTVGEQLLTALRARLDAKKTPPTAETVELNTPIDGVEVLDKLDLTRTLDKKDYERDLLIWQGRLHEVLRSHHFKKRHALVAVFEGNDAAGKGGAIRRVTQALDARQYEIVPIAAPTDEERAHPYLWRFWRRLPRRGELTVFDRSWYGRVLVERVEEFTARQDWLRAYGEINDFEEQLSSHGVITVKFWLAVSQDEQLARFKERESTPWKNFKITDEDWRNREKWGAYAAAVNDMVERTSSDVAPWTLVEAEDKRYARVKVLRTLVEAVERRLE
ncbi:MAG TPA: polyphosphate:AMP phosphotransferase [Polyangiales bacterium]|nr:polyphosphate:AMP phosphotransferase [Polyangiales bacterium]